MAKLSVDKGKRWERAVASSISEVMPGARIRRGDQSRDGADAPDVICPWLWVECKSGKRPNPRAALAQAIEASSRRGSKAVPTVFLKDDRKDPIVILQMDDFLRMLKKLWHTKQNQEE